MEHSPPRSEHKPALQHSHALSHASAEAQGGWATPAAPGLPPASAACRELRLEPTSHSHRELKLEWGQSSAPTSASREKGLTRSCCLAPLLALTSQKQFICLELFCLLSEQTQVPHLTACLSRPGQHTQDHVPGALRAANRHEGWSGRGVRLLRQVLHWRLPEPLQAPNRRLQRHFWYSPSRGVGKSCHPWLCSCKGNPNIRACSSGAARCKPIVLPAFPQFIT